MKKKVYMSNFYLLGAEAIRKQPPKGKAEEAIEHQVSANLRYDPNLSSFYMTASEQQVAQGQDVNLVFEFVIYGNNTMAADVKDRTDKSNQVTVAWTSLPLTALQQKTLKHKLELRGGNPFKEQDLITAEDTDKPKQSKSFLKKIFGGGNKEAQKVQRYINLEVKPFNKQSESTQMELSSLPSTCIVCKPLLSLAVAFRNHCYLLLTKHEQEMTQPHLDLTMVQFPKIYNSPDFQSALAVCWQQVTFQG